MMTIDRPTLTAADFNAMIDALVHRLEREGIRDPLTKEFSLWAVLQDLADVAGIPDDDMHPEVIACGDWPVTAA